MNVGAQEYKRKQPERLEAFNVLHNYWRTSRGIGKDPTWIPFWKKSDLVADCHVPYVEFDDGSQIAISTPKEAKDFIAQYEKDTDAFSREGLRKEIREALTITKKSPWNKGLDSIASEQGTINRGQPGNTKNDEDTLREIGDYLSDELPSHPSDYSAKQIRKFVEQKFGKEVADKFSSSQLRHSWFQFEPQ
jgi:hypothetical protein